MAMAIQMVHLYLSQGNSKVAIQTGGQSDGQRTPPPGISKVANQAGWPWRTELISIYSDYVFSQQVCMLHWDSFEAQNVGNGA